jgi:hypothetical protein
VASGAVRSGLLLLLALAVTAGLGLVGGALLRPSRRARSAPTPDYGLLVAVAKAPDAAAAGALGNRLRSAGIRATVAPAGGPVRISADGWVLPRGVEVLVFPADAEQARRELAGRSG